MDLMENCKKPFFKLNVSRDVALSTFEIWVKSDTEKLNDWIGVVTERIILENKEGLITAYENEKVFEDAEKSLTELMVDENWLPLKLKEYRNNINLVKVYSEHFIKTPNRNTFAELFEQLVIAQGGLAIVYFVPSIDAVNEELKQLCVNERKLTEKFFYDANETLENGIALIYPEFDKYVKVLSVREIIENDIPTKDILIARKKHFIFYEGKFHPYGSTKDVEVELNIQIEQKNVAENQKEIKGRTAFAGIVRGFATVVLTRNDLSKVMEGSIMVCPMTNPDFLPAMKRAAAFVTDEGGITCHAAITAREMNKPCVIGTKIATQVIKEGDFIEVDANSGKVSILDAPNLA